MRILSCQSDEDGSRRRVSVHHPFFVRFQREADDPDQFILKLHMVMLRFDY